MPTFAQRPLRALTGAVCLALSAFAATASAQQPQQPPQQPNPAMFAELGGVGHAVAKVCGGYTEQQLQDMKAQQRGASVQMGMSEADFDAKFAASYEKATADIKAAGQAKQDEMCAQMKAMSGAR